MRSERPETRRPDPDAPPNTHGLRRLAFSVDDVDTTVRTAREQGHERSATSWSSRPGYRLWDLRSPEGLVVMFVQTLR